MEVSRDRLCIIGKIIRIHREEHKRNDKSSKWVQSEFSKGICTPATLSNIEKGAVSRFPENYVELLAKLDLELGEFPAVDNALDILINKLYVALEFSKIEEILKILKKARLLLKDIKSYVYYAELYMIFDRFYEYVKNEVPFTDKFIRVTMELYKVIPPKLVDIMKSATFSNVYVYGSDKEFESISEKLELEKSDYIGNKYNLLIYYAVNDNSIRFLKLCNELEGILTKSSNYTRLFEMYSMSIPLMSYIDTTMIPYYTEKIENLIKQKVIPNEKIADYYYHSGISAYNEGAYAEAIELFDKSLLYDKATILPAALITASCHHRLHNDKYIIIDIDDKVLNDNPELLKAIYVYFKLPKNYPPFLKQEHIMDNIVPYLETNEPLFNNVIKYELEELIKETSQYKDEFTYNIKSRELLEKS